MEKKKKKKKTVETFAPSLHYSTYRKIVAIVGARIVSLTCRRRGQRLVWISFIYEIRRAGGWRWRGGALMQEEEL